MPSQTLAYFMWLLMSGDSLHCDVDATLVPVEGF